MIRHVLCLVLFTPHNRCPPHPLALSRQKLAQEREALQRAVVRSALEGLPWARGGPSRPLMAVEAVLSLLEAPNATRTQTLGLVSGQLSPSDPGLQGLGQQGPRQGKLQVSAVVQGPWIVLEAVP